MSKKFFYATPAFVIVWVLYHLVIFFNSPDVLTEVLFPVSLVSGAVWKVSVSDVLLVVGLIALYLEIIKATWTSAVSVVNHTLSILVFIVFVVEFITTYAAGNSTFFLLAMMSLMDVTAGFTVSLIGARRDINARSNILPR